MGIIFIFAVNIICQRFSPMLLFFTGINSMVIKTFSQVMTINIPLKSYIYKINSMLKFAITRKKVTIYSYMYCIVLLICT